MRSKPLSSIVLAAVALGGCASFQERLAGWEQDSRAAGRPVLVYGVDTQGSTLDLSLSNTGSQTITGLGIMLEPYVSGKPFGAVDGHAYDLGAALPPGGIAAGAHFAARWDTGALGADCLRVTGLKLAFADGNASEVGAGKVDDYLAPVVNKHCSVAPAPGPNNSYGGGRTY